MADISCHRTVSLPPYCLVGVGSGDAIFQTPSVERRSELDETRPDGPMGGVTIERFAVGLRRAIVPGQHDPHDIALCSHVNREIALCPSLLVAPPVETVDPRCQRQR